MLLCVILLWPSKIKNSLILMQNVFEVWEFKEKLIENFIFRRSGFHTSVFEKHLILYTCILFIKYHALRSLCIKLLYFSKFCIFQIFDRWNLFLDRSKLRLKLWFESVWFDRCSIATGLIKCNFRSIDYIFRSIESSLEFFKNISFSRAVSLFKLFQKFFFSLSLIDWDSKQDFLSFSLKNFQGFLSCNTRKTSLPLLFQLFSCLMHFFMQFGENFEPMENWGFWCFQSILSKLIIGFLLWDVIKLIFVV